MLNSCKKNANATLYWFNNSIVEPVATDMSPWVENSQPDNELTQTNSLINARLLLVSVEESGSTREQQTNGLRSSTKLFTGFAVSPLLLPADFPLEQRHYISFEQNGLAQVSKVYHCLVRKPPRSRLRLDRVFGDYLEIEVNSTPYQVQEI